MKLHKKQENKKIGDLGERIACVYLTKKGYRILDTHVRKIWCEIDILAEKDDVVYIIEVKSTRSNPTDYRPEELVHYHKRAKLSRFADWYAAQYRRDVHIQVVVVHIDEDARIGSCKLIEWI